MIKILVDTLGGDNSPSANVAGAIKAINNSDDIEVVLVGDSEKIYEQLDKLAGTYDTSRVSVYHAPDEISCNDKPTEAIKQKTDSSLYQAFKMLREREDVSALVTTGSTGAVLAGAVLKLGRIRGIKRPALCPILPTMSGSVVAVCDSGANVECDSLNLHQFAMMASLYMQKSRGIPRPRVALLNVGVEEEKGDRLRKETYELLKNDTRINFVGNMESRDLLSGDYDVVICDGFAGNVLLKSTEGACLSLMKMLKSRLTSSLKSKMGALLVKKDLMGLKDFMDYNNYGGAILLGCQKTIVKAHGSSKEDSIFHSIMLAASVERNSLREHIAHSLATQSE